MRIPYPAAGKSLLILLAAATLGVLATPQAQATSIGKAAGKYVGGGSLVDHEPTATYSFTFTNMVLQVSSKGKIVGSSDVSVTYTFNGVTTPIPTSSSVTATGKVESLMISGSKISGEGVIKLSDGNTLAGTFAVAAKTGKGTFKIVYSNPQLDLNFVLKKK